MSKVIGKTFPQAQPVEEKTLSKFTKAELEAYCAQKSIDYSDAKTKEQLLLLAKQPSQESPNAPEEPPVQEDPDAKYLT